MVGKLGSIYSENLKTYYHFKSDIHLARYHHWKLERLHKINTLLEAYSAENYDMNDLTDPKVGEFCGYKKVIVNTQQYSITKLKKLIENINFIKYVNSLEAPQITSEMENYSLVEMTEEEKREAEIAAMIEKQM